MNTAASTNHSAQIKSYLMVFGALLVLTVATVTASYLRLPAVLGLMVGLAIATVKASLVAAFFMHLKGERLLIYGLLGLTFLFVVFLFTLPMIDMSAIGINRMPYGGANAMAAPPPATAHH
ncbi:MAG: cytochrome C oxidase subunit IV family protein [Elusimicrobia bacterium]|nr:cytochrome C oxidase subunit IV family protein [Elusimicrobiota bacterium]